MSESPTFLPPLTFEPRFVEKIWGGRRLETHFGKRIPPAAPIGESWEIFDFPPGTVEGNKEWLSSTVATGELKGKTLHEIVTEHQTALLGEKKPTENGQFPLLIKYLDAKDDLSIQVHPTPEYAKAHPEAHLKTECWIVLDHKPDAFLYKSLKEGTTREGLAAAVKNGTVAELVEKVPAVNGECHFLPSGSVHALGAGILIAEIQTPSDTTYRVWDFGRVEAATGKPRKLHVAEALECINFEDPSTPAVTDTRHTDRPLVSCEFFKTTTFRAAAHSIRPLPTGPKGGEMKIWMLVEGQLKLRWGSNQLNLRAGQTVLLPAQLPPSVTATFVKNTTYLETVLP